MALRFWPGSPKVINTIYSVDLLRWVDLLMKNMPGSSLAAFTKVLQELSIEVKYNAFVM